MPRLYIRHPKPGKELPDDRYRLIRHIWTPGSPNKQRRLLEADLIGVEGEPSNVIEVFCNVLDIASEDQVRLILERWLDVCHEEGADILVLVDMFSVQSFENKKL